ncbi:MAG: beta-lactamase family protein [Chitinophagaceae bacterium]|nr:beta-lactamase family protein [Chitinophagaceae bacterium]
MKRSFFTVALFFYTTTLFSQTAESKKLDSLFTALESNNKAMGSVALRENGKLVYSKAIGFASNEHGKPVKATPATIYRIGSISKMYTAALTFQLIQQGKLSLETLLSDYFPTIPNAGKIKIKHLLAHTSGIFNITSDSTYEGWYTTPQSNEAMIARMAKHPADFEPGTAKQYCNSNFILLGYIIEAITQQTYQQNLQLSINSITGAKHTNYGGKTNLNKNEAYSFSYEDNKWIQQPETDMSVPHGAGAITATADDVALFAENYIGGNILNQQWKDTVTSITKQLGYGIIKFNKDNETGYGHNGAIDGFNTEVIYFPGKKISIAFLSNGINYSIDDIMTAAYKIYTGAAYDIPSFKTIQLTDKDLEKFNGVYSSEKIPLKITVSSKNNAMTVQATGQPAFPMDATSANSFSNGQIGVVLEFVLNNDNTVKEMILKQGGAEISFTK